MSHHPRFLLLLFAFAIIVLPSGAQTTIWKPLEKPVREADTLFLPDLSTYESIYASGGFLPSSPTSEKAKENFEFGPGKFSPAVRGKKGSYNFLNFPVDGLLPGTEWTIEFWARSDKPWSAVESDRPLFLLDGHNHIEIMPYKGDLVLEAFSMRDVKEVGFHARWQKKADELGLTANEWHHLALTLKDKTLRFYLNGTEVAKLENTRFLPQWSDGTHSPAVHLGGAPGASTEYWISDVRFSATARVPGQEVKLRSLEGVLSIDAARSQGKVPAQLLGSLHPGGTPEQDRAALHVVRTDKFLTATPMKRGVPDDAHPSAGKSGKFSYNWKVADRTLDWFALHGVTPFISIDSTPSILGGGTAPFNEAWLNDPKVTTAWSNFTPQPPNNLADWATIVGDFVHHVAQEKKIEVGWWGVWNEPDGPTFWNAGLPGYLDLYAATAPAVKAASPEARIGGPSLSELSPHTEKWIHELFARAAKDKLPLDFIEYHEYSGDLLQLDRARLVIDEAAKANGFPTPFPIVIGEFNYSAEALYKTGLPQWSGGAWTLRSYNGAYTTATLIRMLQLGGFELLIGPFRSDVDPRHGGWDSAQMTGPNGKQWAVYNVFRGWKETIQSEVLASEVDLPPGVWAIATRDPKTGKLGLALSSFGYGLRESRNVTINLKSLQAGDWKMRRALVDTKHSSRWDVAEDRSEGDKHNDLEWVEEKNLQAKANAPLTLQVELPMWSSTFITLTPAKP